MAINTNTQKQTSKNRSAEETKSFMEKAYNQAEQELEKYLKKMNKTDKQIRLFRDVKWRLRMSLLVITQN